MFSKLKYLDWTGYEITSSEQVINIIKEVKNYDFITVDTETSGLHIILDKAFCISFALVDLKNKIGKAYICKVDNVTDDFKALLQIMFNSAKLLIAWNAKFDAHMCTNIGINLLKNKTYTDAMIYARLATDALTPDKGGPVLKLKDFCKRFINKESDKYEKEVNQLKKEILLKRNEELKKLKVNIGKLNKYLEDKTNDINDLPKEVVNVWTNPIYNPNDYRNIPWNKLKVYAIFDVILTAEAYIYCYPIVKERQQLDIAEKETKIIPILYEMERTGIAINKFYLLQTKANVKEYILQRRQDMCEFAGEQFKVGQHDTIKRIFKEKFNYELESSDEKSLSALTTVDDDKSKLAKMILELRTLEKWYSTYICKWLEQTRDIDRIYTSFNQCGAVSGRFSSDFQQFPKDSITKANGEVLFVPRRMVKISGNGYESLYFIDFSAEELRFQAAYTILIGHPDLNLCRAFMPFKCDATTWTPTDLHTLTTLTAFPELKESDPDFKHYRYIGKRANFCINYGGTKKALMENLGVSEEIASQLYEAYKKAYPGVQKYKEYVYTILSNQNYITNLFGRRYYNASGHNCCNYLIQGSGADLLKNKLIELYEFLKPYKTRMVCMIHDEIVFEVYAGEEHIVPDLKRIMETFPALPIPLKSEVEYTNTTWDAKKPIAI